MATQRDVEEAFERGKQAAIQEGAYEAGREYGEKRIALMESDVVFKRLVIVFEYLVGKGVSKDQAAKTAGLLANGGLVFPDSNG